MRKKKQVLFLIIAIGFSAVSFSQTLQENTGWLALFNSYKFSKHFSLTSDVQFRSADDWQYVRNILIRSGFTYQFNSKNSVAVGYAYVETYNRLPEPLKSSLTENRIWEQYINSAKFGVVTLNNRLRLEQRFIERQTENIFSQRLRYLIKTVIPLTKQKQVFAKGIYAAVQNEIFLNVQNKDKINNSLFDQNRAYGGIGYRFNPKVDLEAGYMNQYIKGQIADVSNNVIQLALYTRF